MKKLFIYFILIISIHVSVAQETTTWLDQYAIEKPALNEPIQVDVSGLPLYDFLNSIAVEHQLNISADTDLNQIVSHSFFDIPVKEVFAFVAKKYDVNVELINNIIVFKKKEKPVAKPVKKQQKQIEASYNSQNDFLSLRLKNDSIIRVAQKITDISGKNIVLAPQIKNKKISAYILNRPFDQVVEMMAKSNQMVVNKDENGFYYLDEDPDYIESANNSRTTGNRNSRRKQKRRTGSTADITIDKNGFLNVNAFDADVTEMIIEAAEKLNVNYFMYEKPEKITATLVANAITFDELLKHVLRGKEIAFKKTGDFYLIGDQKAEGLRSSVLIQLENRTVEKVIETLPKDLIKGIEIKEVLELNGFIVSGDRDNIAELKQYVRHIDKVVPMVLIEVLIVQYQKGHEIQTGIQAGIDNQQRTTSGSVFPTTDVTLSSGSVNKLIDAFNGFGIFNIGKVTKNFYLNLRALENNSIIKLQSTPKIAALNGFEAKLSIGETNYYFEQNNRLINSGLGNDVLQSGVWKPTEANLSVTIKPFVSKDEQITLTIGVEKSSFLGRAGENAPPGKSTQQFESLVRVKNGEMILLGGLDEIEKEDIGTGTPLLSRIPIIKWFFSSKEKRKRKSKLHVFVKPTVVY